jgi:hypothetical protein
MTEAEKRGRSVGGIGREGHLGAGERVRDVTPSVWVTGFHAVGLKNPADVGRRPGNGREDGTGAHRKTDRRGAVYVVAPTGCGLTRTDTDVHPAFVLTIPNTAGSIVVDVNGSRLDFRCIMASGVIGDYFTILKGTEATPPRAIWPANVSNGRFSIGFQATAGLTYTIQSTSLLPGGWQDRTNVTAPASGIILLEDSILGAPQQFYRLAYPAQP